MTSSSSEDDLLDSCSVDFPVSRYESPSPFFSVSSSLPKISVDRIVEIVRNKYYVYIRQKNRRLDRALD